MNEIPWTKVWAAVCLLLTALFTTLKVTEVIAWSWLWVLAPLWIGAIVWFIAAVIIIIIVVTMLAAIGFSFIAAVLGRFK